MITDRMGLLHDVADAVASAMRTVTDWGPSGARVGQYALDVTADDAALAVLRKAGVGVLSEESGFDPGTNGEVVVIDPIDGSTNASRGLPWFATSLCFVDDDGPAVALVVNQATGVRFSAERGGGAWCGERRLQATLSAPRPFASLGRESHAGGLVDHQCDRRAVVVEEAQ